MSNNKFLETFDALLPLNKSHKVCINELITSLKTVNTLITDETNKNAFDDEILIKIIALLSQFGDDLIAASPIWTELFRFLRNYAAISAERQNAIVRSSYLFETSIQRVLYLVSELSNGYSQFGMMPELRCGIQFLGNLVTNNESNKRLLESRLLSTVDILLSSEDDKLKNYVTMLIYNVLIGLPDSRDAFLHSSPNASNVVSSFLSLNGCEWSLFAVEYFLESPKFLERFYPKLKSIERIVLLDVLDSILNESRALKVEVSPSNLCFLASEFIKRADVILQINELSSESIEPLEVIRCIAVLCSASSNLSFVFRLQSVSELLCTAIVLLKAVHMAGKEPSANCFTPIESVGAVVRAFESANPIDPSDGLKCSLIRLVANLCWRNRANQDKVREFDGIPLLLDCCKLDAKNPFIVQYVIFAIRNLCENNNENQEVIACLDMKAVTSSGVVEELGFAVSEDETGRLVIEFARGAESKFEQARRDIKDLFL